VNRKRWESLACEMPSSLDVKTKAYLQYLPLCLGFCSLISACGGRESDDLDELANPEAETSEARSELKPSRRVISLYSDVSELSLRSYIRGTGPDYILDYAATCSPGVQCQFIVNRSSVAEVMGMLAGDWRDTLDIQNNGFDACLLQNGDFGIGPSTRVDCRLEDVRYDAGLTFSWQ